jgi:hypothetical protein
MPEVPDLIVPLVSKRRERAKLFQKLQHVLPAGVLLMHGLDRLQTGADVASRVLGAAEAGTSLLVIATFVRSVRRRREAAHVSASHDAHHAVDWVDLFLGAMLAVEVWSHWHETGHLRRPTVLLAVTMVALGLFHGRLTAFTTRRRSLRIGASGLTVGGRFLGRWDADWAQIVRIDLDARYARIVRKDGRVRTIDLNDLANAGDVRLALEDARLRSAPATHVDGAPAEA